MLSAVNHSNSASHDTSRTQRGASFTKEQTLKDMQEKICSKKGENAIRKSWSLPPSLHVSLRAFLSVLLYLVCVLLDNLKEANYAHHLSDNLFAQTQHGQLVQNQV